MSMHKSLGTLLAIALGLLVVTPSLDVQAKPGSGKKGASAATLKSKISVRPKTLHWGMSHRDVQKVYMKVIDKDYLKDYQKAQPGVQMKMLDHEVASKKREFTSSLVEFGDLPTRLDGTPFRGEFTYKNSESMLEIARKKMKRHRHLFFIRNQLWKVIDVYKLGGKSRYGSDYNSAVAKIEKILSVKGHVIKANPNEGVKEERRWTDGKTGLRLVNWDKSHIALVYEDEGTVAKLASLRTQKPEEKKAGDDLDPDTKAALR